VKTILVVDDKASVRQLLQDYLRTQGFDVVVASNGREALYSARHSRPDLILLDIMMPEMDGFEFLRRHRQEKNTPVIIITAREEETDAVLGLELGADDYVVKPFRMRELVSRVRAVLRRIENLPTGERVLRAGKVSLDEATREVRSGEELVRLTGTEYNLLHTLMSSPGRVFTRQQLTDQLGEKGFAGMERTLNVHVRNLRKKIEPDADNPLYIETVFGVGYRFNNTLDKS
jgi:DNA-binding response OmpR family regulator